MNARLNFQVEIILDNLQWSLFRRKGKLLFPDVSSDSGKRTGWTAFQQSKSPCPNHGNGSLAVGVTEHTGTRLLTTVG